MPGNTIVDAVQTHRELAAEESTVLDEYGCAAGEFILMTAHRAENVDSLDRLKKSSMVSTVLHGS